MGCIAWVHSPDGIHLIPRDVRSMLYACTIGPAVYRYIYITNILPIIQIITTRNMALLALSYIMAMHGVDYTTILNDSKTGRQKRLLLAPSQASYVGTCYKLRGWPSRPYPETLLTNNCGERPEAN